MSDEHSWSTMPTIRAMLRTSCAVIIIAATSSGPLAGQERAPAAATRQPQASARHFAQRVAAGYVGDVIGIVALGAIGYRLDRYTDLSSGDDPGLTGLALGATVGAILGSTIGAALPVGSGGCTFRTQWARALYGMGVVALPAGFAAAIAGEHGLFIIVPVTVGPIASAAALHEC